MLAFHQPAYRIRRAEAAETGLIGYLRLASLICLEMAGHPLDAIRAVMSRLPDVDADLVAAGRYFVADHAGELLGGAGWSVLPLSFRGDRLIDGSGRPATLSLSDNGVLLRGFFLDPDLGRRGAGASLLAQVEAEIARAGHACAEIVVPASSQIFYRSLGFRPVRELALSIERGGPLPMLQMRKCLPVRLAAAA
jgi:GNAT superfamily N-acetyltransferase